jgi:exonuclease VII large subunit
MAETALQSKIIVHQQQQIRSLQAQVHQLEKDVTELQQMLTIVLEDSREPIVINQSRLREISPSFVLERNFDGDLLVKLKGARA